MGRNLIWSSILFLDPIVFRRNFFNFFPNFLVKIDELEIRMLLQNWFEPIILKAVRTGMIKSAIAILDDECILRLQNDGHIYGSDSILMPHGKLEPDLHGWSDHARRPCANIKNPKPLLITFIMRIASKLIVAARKEFKQYGTDSISMLIRSCPPSAVHVLIWRILGYFWYIANWS